MLTTEKKIGGILYWSPRVLSIILILFLMMFSLDVFESGLSGWQIVIGLFMHNIPALILLIITIISWKREIVGGVVFILAGILYIFLLIRNPEFEWYMITWALTISGPAFFVGILYLVGWYKKKNKL